MPRFVLLEHDWPHHHWDLMLEVDEVLRTWRLAGPLTPGRNIQVESIADHRRAYLEYEGPVSGGRGRVTRWDSGEFAWRKEDDSCVIVLLAGKTCKGLLEIDKKTGIARLREAPLSG